MSSSVLGKKLHLRAGDRIALLHAPPDAPPLFEPLPADTTLDTTPHGRYGVVMLFVATQADLVARMEAAIAALTGDGVLWVAYPKRAAKVQTDLTRDEGWTPLTSRGYEAVAMVAVDPVWSAVRFRRAAMTSEADRVAAQFAGPKAALLPLYERAVAYITGLGRDVTVHPRQSYVAFARAKQFATVRAATKDRLEIGLKLPNASATPRLVTAGNLGGGSMTHKVALFYVDEFDDELMAWLADAYQRAET